MDISNRGLRLISIFKEVTLFIFGEVEFDW